MERDDQITSMWMNTKMNNNINIILIDSLKSLHQREFSLQSSQRQVVLVSHCHERLTNIKVGCKGRKWKRNGFKQISQSSGIDFLQQWLLCFLVPLLLIGFFVLKETIVSFLFICFTNWLFNQNFLVCLVWYLRWAHMSSWIKWS